MARTLSGALEPWTSTQYGSKPTTVVKIEWPYGTKYYSDRDFSFGPGSCDPKILSLGNIVSQQKMDSASDVGSTSISLDDTDNTIKTSVNRDLIAGTRVTIYQTYDVPYPVPVISEEDALVLLKGRISNDVAWSEGQRTISFSIDTSFNTTELGYAPKRGDLANLSVDAEGKMWPIVFGSCIKVPAVQIYKSIKGVLASYLRYDTTVINVDGGDSFPQGSMVQINVGNGLLCTGSFSGNAFTISTYNDPWYQTITFASRVADADYSDPSVAWIVGTANIQGQYCHVTYAGQKLVNYCTKQIGTKCWFAKPWKINGIAATYLMPESGFTAIAETSFFVRLAWGDTFKLETIDGAFSSTVSEVNVNTAVQLPGFAVRLHDGTIPTYVVNDAVSTSIKGVYAYRTVDGQKKLTAVPSSYYTKYLSTTIAGRTVTAITFSRQLSWYAGQDWEDDLYVTLVSSLSPNTANVIKYILETYSDYTTDPNPLASFTTVATKINAYPSHFAILDQKDVLSLVADIAFQARLAVRYAGDEAKLYYLSELPSTVEVFTDDTIRSKTLEYGFTSLDDIVTKYVAKWRPSYDVDTRDYVYKNNQSTFGVKEDEREFFIYNIASLVKLSADFWGNRLSNSWRTAKLSTFLQALDVETFDCVRITTSTLATAGIRGEVVETSHDTLQDDISLEVKLASKSGLHDAGTIIEDTTFFTGGVTGLEATPADPTTGVAEEDYQIIVPTDDAPPQNVIKPTIKFTSVPTRIVRGVSFNVSAKITNDDGSTKMVNVTLPIELFENSESDTLSVSTISFVNGVASASMTASGGSTDTECTLNIIGGSSYSTAVTSGIDITSEPTLIWTVDHTGLARGATFDISLSGGLPSTVYTISLDSQDPDEELQTSGGSPVTSITTDGSGNYSATWKFVDGTFALNSVLIIATHSGHNYPSPEFLIVSAGGLSDNITAIAKVTAQHATLTTEVTCSIYPHGRTTEGGDITWAGATVNILQISATSEKIPVNTWLIVVGTKKIPAPDPIMSDYTDYNWYAQPPIWM